MTCAWCGQPATRTLAAQDLCDACWHGFREPILERVIIAEDISATLIRDGMSRPDHGPGFADCACVSCDATLVAVPGEPCPYCAVAWDRMRVWQAAKTLNPSLPDPHDQRYHPAVTAWLERLTVAIAAGIITEPEARSAWQRRVLRVAA